MVARALPIVQPRTCGECAVCCDFVSIAEINKPARVPCRFLEPEGYGCTTYDKGRPGVCVDFLCAWMQGMGSDGDRPDKIGAMLSIHNIPDGRYALCIELRPGAIDSTASSMVASVANATRLPVIVSNYESLPPDDKGDRVAVHTSILYRSRRLVGRLLSWLAPDVALYDLVKGG